MNKDNWALKSMITMTIAMSFNFILFMAILQRNIIGCYFYKLEFAFLSEHQNNVITIIILFVLPCVILNYVLIFRKMRYEKLIEKYPYYNGKLSIRYFLISLFLPVILLIAGIIYTKYF
jgi:hypothetical protein